MMCALMIQNQTDLAPQFQKFISVSHDIDAANSSNKYESVDLNKSKGYKSLDLFSHTLHVVPRVCYDT